jgi:hypothetical protein
MDMKARQGTEEKVRDGLQMGVMGMWIVEGEVEILRSRACKLERSAVRKRQRPGGQVSTMSAWYHVATWEATVCADVVSGGLLGW